MRQKLEAAIDSLNDSIRFMVAYDDSFLDGTIGSAMRAINHAELMLDGVDLGIDHERLCQFAEQVAEEIAKVKGGDA